MSISPGCLSQKSQAKKSLKVARPKALHTRLKKFTSTKIAKMKKFSK
jgi:hypothetical protein